ncbi:FeoA family protein [Candidatus Deianiraea vastatrix]|uniref:Ferrous iron transporter FeoA-like domain-containing protein n=1 Tax=Candidatus Deianiraea vastatrix TaxID=2163644 RepID=A0A5B8XFY7_9RICK|nr:FeoA family protein [Candidatus Deianiraea vastatrix]QED23795.1 hypothetical protein Deia_01011 [Candidatus Deianiraea vastatrix]
MTLNSAKIGVLYKILSLEITAPECLYFESFGIKNGTVFRVLNKSLLGKIIQVEISLGLGKTCIMIRKSDAKKIICSKL